MTAGAVRHTHDDGAVLLTGATGFLGLEVLARLIERTDRTVYAVVRAEDDRAAQERLRGLLRTACGPGLDREADRRVVAVRGDIEEPALGLGEERAGQLAEEVGDVLHVAATVSFTLPLEQSRRVNVGGTRHALQFAERCAENGELRRFSYVSTAYVAGTHEGPFREDDLDVGQAFHNAYEATKFEAECLVRAHAERMPIQVFRPSIIVGDSTTGWTTSFNVIYSPLRAFQSQRIYAVPGRSDAPVDVVPVDFVADAITELVEHPDADRDTHHLVAGADASTVGELVDLAARHFGKRRPRVIPASVYVPLIRPLLLAVNPSKGRRILRKLEVFNPYFSLPVRYDDARTRRRLSRAGISVKPVSAYFERLMDFAVRAEWGKAEVRREAVA
jgi:thioester reductase-like protein